MTLSQNPIIKAWAQDTANKSTFTQAEIGTGITLEADAVSNQLNGISYIVYQAIQFLQNTGGLYNSTIPYINPNLVGLITYNSGVYGLNYYLRTSNNPGSTTNNPPITGASISTVNGIDIYSGGSANTDWQLITNSTDLMKISTYDPNNIAQNIFPLSGASDPAVTPLFLGQEYVNTTTKNIFKAIGTSSSADWILITQDIKMGSMFSGGIGQAALTANTLFGWKYTCLKSGYINTVNLAKTYATSGAKIVVGIYSDSAVTPNSKLVQASELTISNNGTNYEWLNFVLQSPLFVTRGTNYWIAMNTNTNITLERDIANNGTCGLYKGSVTYNATLPSSFGAASGSTDHCIATAF